MAKIKKYTSWEKRHQNKVRASGRQITASIIVLTIPLMCLLLASGFMLKSQTLMEYNLNSTQAVDTCGYAIDQDEFIETVAGYMNSSDLELELIENTSYMPENVFTQEEADYLASVRTFANLQIMGGIALFVINVIIYFLLVRWREDALHRRVFKFSAIFFVLMATARALFNLVPVLRNWEYATLIGCAIPKDGCLVSCFAELYPQHLTVFQVGLAAIIYLLIAYVTYKLARNKKLFKGTM